MKHCAILRQFFFYLTNLVILIYNLSNSFFHPTCREFTGHNSPMISTDSEMAYGPSHPGYLYNVFDSINLYIDGGMDPSKIVLGMPLYGRGWELVDPVTCTKFKITNKIEISVQFPFLD